MLRKWLAMDSKFPKQMVLPRANLPLVWRFSSVTIASSMNEPSKHSDECTLQIPLPGVPTVSIFCTGKSHGLEYHALCLAV
jgi:hypothetical protein